MCAAPRDARGAPQSLPDNRLVRRPPRTPRHRGACLVFVMALVVAGLLADGPTVVEGIDCIATSYPDFVATCRALAGEDAVEVVA